MEHIGARRLETARLLMRPLRVEDAPAYASVWWAQKGPVVWAPPFSNERTRALAERMRAFAADDAYGWGIAQKRDDRIIGEIFTVNNDEARRSCEIVYGIAPAHRGQGFAAEALACVLRFLLLEAGFNRVQGGHLADNPASGRVMVKAGMTYEGTLRQDNLNRQGMLTDSRIYSMIRQDIEERKAQVRRAFEDSAP